LKSTSLCRIGQFFISNIDYQLKKYNPVTTASRSHLQNNALLHAESQSDSACFRSMQKTVCHVARFLALVARPANMKKAVYFLAHYLFDNRQPEPK
jgi:hypothetical protein